MPDDNDKIYINSYVEREDYERMERLADELHVSRSGLIAIAASSLANRLGDSWPPACEFHEGEHTKYATQEHIDSCPTCRAALGLPEPKEEPTEEPTEEPEPESTSRTNRVGVTRYD